MIFTQFWAIFRKFFAHPINPKGLVFYIFQGLIHIFKILQNSRTIPGQKALFLKFQEFSRTKVKFKNFSRSVRALFVHFEMEFQKFRILEILNFHPCVESTMILYSSL